MLDAIRQVARGESYLPTRLAVLATLSDLHTQPIRYDLDELARIAPLVKDHRGDQVFKVTVDVSDVTGLRWGMTANVEIAASK